MRKSRRGPLRPRLLIVDEHRRTFDELRNAFIEHGCECEVALDLETGLQVLRERRMTMTIVNSLVSIDSDEKLIGELKAIDPDMALVIFNGTKKKALQRKLRRLGAHGYLSEASDLPAVVRTVQRVLAERA